MPEDFDTRNKREMIFRTCKEKCLGIYDCNIFLKLRTVQTHKGKNYGSNYHNCTQNLDRCLVYCKNLEMFKIASGYSK